jgi:large subunit ribosomal protein L10
MVTDLNSVLTRTELIVVAHYAGLKVAQISDLRHQMREMGAGFRVTKNRLMRLALDGTRYQQLADMFAGPTAIAFSEDPIAAAKVAVDYAKKNNKLVIIGGAMGDVRLDPDGVKALAAMPSLDALRGKLVGLIQAPATKIAGVLQAPAGQLARVLQAKSERQEAA